MSSSPSANASYRFNPGRYAGRKSKKVLRAVDKEERKMELRDIRDEEERKARS